MAKCLFCLTVLTFTKFYSFYIRIQDTEGCKAYTTILYSRTIEEKLPGNITGTVKNVSTHTAGDGSGGEAPISNAKKLE